MNQMADKSKKLTPFAAKLRKWQSEKGFQQKDAADFLGVEITTYRHWLYDGAEPSGSPCKDCVVKKMAE